MRIAALTATVLLLGMGVAACTPDRLAVDDPAVREGARELPPAQAAAMPMPAPGVNAAPAGNPADYRAYQAAKTQLLPLLASGNPRQRLAALLMQPDFPHDDWHQAVVALLLADGGRDPLLAGQALVACAGWKACPREQVLALTAGQAADDARLQLLRLALSEPALHESLWEAAAQAPLYVDPFETQVEALMAATAPLATGTQNDHWRAVEAVAIASTASGSELHQLDQRCPPASSVNERVLQCRQLALRLAESPTVVTAQMGMAVLLRQALPAAEAARWGQLQRQLRWQLQLALPLVDAEPMYPRQMAEHGERGAIIWLLRQRGLPLNPPPHWQPGQPTGY